MIHFRARRAHCLFAALAMAAATQSVFAQDTYPNRPVTMVSPFSVGSGPDTVLRLVGEKLGTLWGQRVIVENKPGGAGFIAIDGFRRVTADGYTLLQLDSEQLAALPHLYKQRNYDPGATFDYAASLFRTPFLVATSADSPWHTVNDIVAASRKKPNAVTYGSWGIGSPGHLGGVALGMATGTEMLHVPYKEMPQLFASVSNSDVNWSFASMASSVGAYKAGKIRYLAVAAPRRLEQLPAVPTVSENGGPPNFEVNSFAALVVPKGVPPAVIAKINADVAKVLADPDIKARFATFAFEPIAWTPAEIRQNVTAKSATYRELIKTANITLD